MGRKVRKQLNIDETQDLLLKREAERLGVSESEVVRRALDAWVREDAGSRRQRAVEGLRALQVKLDARRREHGPGEPYTWNRAELYEEEDAGDAR
jgi:Arc/MetJ-type ribon-helix-helix transcriptional regulator